MQGSTAFGIPAINQPASRLLRIKPIKLAAMALVLLPVFATPVAVAQMPEPPSPGIVEDSLRPLPITPRPAGPDAAITAPMSPAPPPASPAGEGPEITVQRFEFDGNAAFSDAALREHIADYQGRPLRLQELYAAADQLTTFYQNQGYSVALVTIPAQRVRDGVVRLEVVEGRIGEIHLEGHAHYREEWLRQRLTGLHTGAILRFDQLERNVLLLNDLPGLTVRSVLSPGTGYGTSDLLLRMEERRWSGRISADNHGPETIGQWRMGGQIAINNPLRMGDQLDLGVTLSESGLLRQGRLGWSHPLGNQGARLSWQYSRIHYDVGGDFANLDIAGHSETARVDYQLPLVRSREYSTLAGASLSRLRGRSEFDGIPLSDTAVTVAEGRYTLDRRQGRTVQVLDTRMATNLRRNAEGERDDAVALLGSVHLWSETRMGDNWGWQARGSLQLSADPLPDSQKFSLGGPHSIRGFTTSRQRGDQGIAVGTELRRYQPVAAGSLIFKGFLDAGTVQRIRPAEGIPRTDSLSAAGLGISGLFAERHHLDLTWARPLSGKAAEDDANQVWFIMGTNF